MIRTQIQLTEEQLRRLKALAAARGLSVAELIRQSIDAFSRSAASPDAEARCQRAIAVAGHFHSGKRDVSAQHDRYLAEAWHE